MHDPESVCRVCLKPLPNGEARYNDHKMFNDQRCTGPICASCADNNPDEFHIKYKNFIKEFGYTTVMPEKAED